METEIVGWLADREEATRAHAKTLPCRRRHASAVVIVGAMMTVACMWQPSRIQAKDYKRGFRGCRRNDLVRRRLVRISASRDSQLNVCALGRSGPSSARR